MGCFKSVYTMLQVPSCGVGRMVKPYPLGHILDLLVDIWRASISRLLDIRLGASVALLKEVVILCSIGIFYVVGMLGRWSLA